jgi:hypothetical protein
MIAGADGDHREVALIGAGLRASVIAWLPQRLTSGHIQPLLALLAARRIVPRGAASHRVERT